MWGIDPFSPVLDCASPLALLDAFKSWMRRLRCERERVRMKSGPDAKSGPQSKTLRDY
jgi:hypothetical protein